MEEKLNVKNKLIAYLPSILAYKMTLKISNWNVGFGLYLPYKTVPSKAATVYTRLGKNCMEDGFSTWYFLG